MDKPRVKPLVWERSKGVQTDFKAKCVIGVYLVECFDDGEGDYYVWALEWGKIEGPKMASADEAKAAAQADYEARILAALEPVTVQEAARVLLDAYDGFMAGKPENEYTRSVSTAACFGAAAYEKGVGGQGVHALARSFLIALIDPTDPQLDYLRADPDSGKTAREAVAALRALAQKDAE
jgi:hypothetical protein